MVGEGDEEGVRNKRDEKEWGVCTVAVHAHYVVLEIGDPSTFEWPPEWLFDVLSGSEGGYKPPCPLCLIPRAVLPLLTINPFEAMTPSLISLLLALTTLATFTHAFPILTFPSDPLVSRSENVTSLNELHNCLSSIGGNPQLSYSTDATYTNLSSSYNPLFHYQPLLIALPTSENEVASIVKCVSIHKGEFKLTPRSGGHSYEAYSLGGRNGSIVIDLSHLQSITINSGKREATVGAGVRLGTLATVLGEKGFALPHGTCPLVGVAGHTLGGGFGFTTRAWGFLLDRIVGLKMVDKDGNIHTVTQATEEGKEGLWWGLRGAGANQFGIVTSFTFSLLPAPTQILNYVYSYKTNTDCARAIVALQTLTLSPTSQTGLEPEFGGELLIAGEKAGDFDGNACQLSGQHINSSTEKHKDLISRFHSLAGITPAVTSVKPFHSWLDALTDIMGNLNSTALLAAGPAHEQFYAKSLIQPATPTYTYSSALTLVQKLNNYAGLQGTGNSISFDFLGPLSYSSAKAEEETGKAVFNARHAAFVYQFYSYGFPADDNPEGQKEVWDAFDDLVNTAKDSGKGKEVGWGAYVNYVDARQENWAKAYYGEGVERLKELKKKWDPENVFWFPQSIVNA